ncbi:MAG: MBOAT family O-acyltransferase [Bacteroidota bacterium]
MKHKYRWGLLLIGSCYFYMYFIPIYIVILAVTIVIDYFAGILIHNAEGNKKKKFLIISIVANIGVLAFFKYYGFLNENISLILTQFNIRSPLPNLSFLLPVGLSFHTFQAMSYTIEVYKGKQKPERHFGYYALYVMYFPQLVAGPIERPQNMLHQFHKNHLFNWHRFLHGSQLMLWGFFKKVVVADRLAVYILQGFAETNPWFHFVSAVFFSFQIYCDFSGYSDIAAGSSKIMGIELMQNFNKPYQAKTISGFWSRWHISLSTWFKDYLYIPLGGNKNGEWKKMRNLGLVFLISGLWHGASWTFVFWGGLHAVFTLAESIILKNTWVSTIGKLFINKLTVFLCVTFAWIFFRINNFSMAYMTCVSAKDGLLNFVSDLFRYNFFEELTRYQLLTFSTPDKAICGFALLALLLGDRLFDLYKEKLNGNRQIFFFVILSTIIAVFGYSNNEQFIYFQF